MAYSSFNPTGGGQEPARSEIVLVGTSTVQVSAYRSNYADPRKNILIRNTSANATSIITINFAFGPVVANAGVVLRQYESWSDSSESGYDCIQGVITAVCADANGQLSVYER